MGDEGRKVLNVCVKVKIYGKLEIWKYDLSVSLERLRGCFAGSNIWWYFYEYVFFFNKYGNFKSFYDIVDIYDVFVEFDERKCVVKYIKEGFEFVK